MSSIAKLSLVGLVGVHSFGTSPTHSCDPGHIKFAIEPDWGAWSTCIGNECSGVVQPLYQKICHVEGLDCSHVVTAWSNIWDGNKGAGWALPEFDVAAAARNTGPRLAQCMHYSNPWTAPSQGFLMTTAANNPAMASWPAGTEVTLCAMSGWAIGTPYLEELQMQGANGWDITIMDYFEDQESTTQAVLSGDCDAALFDGDLSGGLLETVLEVPVTDHQVGGVSYMTDGTNPNSACIIERINHGLATLRSDGTLTSLLKSNPDFTDTPELDFIHVNEQCA